MNGVHDLGGRHGFGPVEVEQDEPVFHHRWEGRVRGMMAGGLRGLFNLDEFRHAIERMPPAEYLRAGYYERWLWAVETLAREKGVAGWVPGQAERAAAAGREHQKTPAGTQARYQPGDKVRARNLTPSGHTRLPRYARGRRGTVRLVRGPFLLPDTNAHGGGPDWEHVYTVEFAAAELWGEQAEPRQTVRVDLWESYLETAG